MFQWCASSVASLQKYYLSPLMSMVSTLPLLKASKDSLQMNFGINENKMTDGAIENKMTE